MSAAHAIVGRRIAMHAWRESGDDKRNENPRTGVVVGCQLGQSTEPDSGEHDSDYYVLIAFDDGGLGTAVAPFAGDALNRTYLLLLPDGQ